MPLPVIPNVSRVAFKWHNSDSKTDAVNVMHFHTGSHSSADFATLLDSSLTANMWAYQNTDSVITEIDITPLDGMSITFPFVPTPGVKYHGTQTNEDMSPQVAAIIKLATAERGRSFRGRVYLPWVIDNAQVNGILDATINASVATAWLAFKNAMETGGMQMVVASYKLASAADVIAVVAEKYTATQRRRQKRTSA